MRITKMDKLAVTKSWAEKELKKFQDAHKSDRAGCHCEYGHIDCSYRANGPCFDEFMANHEELID